MTNIKYMGHTFRGTAGEWTLGDENNQCCEVALPGELTICLDRQDRYDGNVVISREQMLANCHLVIAAPKLLQALIAAKASIDLIAEDWPNSLYDVRDDQAMMDAAILQALGVECQYHGTDADACKTYSGDLPCDPVK